MWEDTRIFPLYGVGVSVVLFALCALHTRWTRPAPKYAPVLHAEAEDCAAERLVQRDGVQSLVKRAGGPALFLARFARLVFCVLLFGVSLAALLSRPVDTWRTVGAPWWPDLVECEVYVSYSLSFYCVYC